MPPACLFYFLWLGVGLAQAQTCSKPAAGPHMDLVYDDDQKTTFEDQSTATFTCATGYRSGGGSAVITCTAGAWSAVQLKCIRKECGSPGELENGDLDTPGVEFGDKITATCRPGYTLVGPNTLICGDRGWLGRLPRCEAVVCYPPEVVNASPSESIKENYNYLEAIRFKCLSGYTLNGSALISCSEDGTFKPDPPTCIKVLCETPDIENAVRDGGGAPPYGHTDFVIYKCKAGYTMTGEASVTCGINSQWSPALPKCIAIPTTTKATTTTTTATTTTTTAKKVPVPVSDRSPTATDPPIGPPNGSNFLESPLFIALASLAGLGAIIGTGVYLVRKRNRKRSQQHPDYKGSVAVKDEDPDL